MREIATFYFIGQLLMNVLMGVNMQDQDIINKMVDLGAKYTPNKEYAAYVDFSKKSDQPRFFLVNLHDKTIEYRGYTSHGVNSGNLLQAVRFSNVWGSKKSSLGLMVTDDTYYGRHGYSLRLIGMDKGINDNVRARDIVLHPAYYVSSEYVKIHHFPGRSWGCITLDPAVSEDIINKLKEGSLLYVGD